MQSRKHSLNGWFMCHDCLDYGISNNIRLHPADPLATLGQHQECCAVGHQGKDARQKWLDLRQQCEADGLDLASVLP